MLAMFFIIHGVQLNKSCASIIGTFSILWVKFFRRQAMFVNPSLVSAYDG